MGSLNLRYRLPRTIPLQSSLRRKRWVIFVDLLFSLHLPLLARVIGFRVH